MRNVNPKTVFELDELLAQLKTSAFGRNDIFFFKKYQKFIEENAELPNYQFFPEIVFREGSMLYPQMHEYSFEKLLSRNKQKIIPFSVGLRIRRLDSISEVEGDVISNIFMSEEEMLGALYSLLKGDCPVKLNKNDYFYLYSVSTDGKIFSENWINWKGNYWSIKSQEINQIKSNFEKNGDILLVI